MSIASASATSRMSAPAAKASSLPVSTMAWISGSDPRAWKRSASLARKSRLSAFLASGRLIRSSATPGAGVSLSNMSAAIPPLPCPGVRADVSEPATWFQAPSRQSSVRARELCDEVIYVISGSGSTSGETPKRTLSFEWGPRSLFAIPLNHPYRLHNGSGSEKVRFVSVNTIPIVYNLFRDARFVFGADWHFDRIDVDADPADMELYQPDPKHERTAVNLYQTSFVPHVLAVRRRP